MNRKYEDLHQNRLLRVHQWTKEPSYWTMGFLSQGINQDGIVQVHGSLNTMITGSSYAHACTLDVIRHWCHGFESVCWRFVSPRRARNPGVTGGCGEAFTYH